MRLEHQHAGQAAHPVDIRKPGWSGRSHRWRHSYEARGQYTKQKQLEPPPGPGTVCWQRPPQDKAGETHNLKYESHPPCDPADAIPFNPGETNE